MPVKRLGYLAKRIYLAIYLAIWRNNGSFIPIIRHRAQSDPEFCPLVHVEDHGNFIRRMNDLDALLSEHTAGKAVLRSSVYMFEET